MKNPIIRTIYLYLFALTGLALVSIGAVRFVNLGLKTFLFTKADEHADYEARPPFTMPYPPKEKEMTEENFVQALGKCKDTCTLTDTQKEKLSLWLNDYEEWKTQPKVDYKTRERHRDSSFSLAFILVGLPLWLYHWRIIKKEARVT